MKKIVFLSGTRADFGKMKSLMLSVQKEKNIHMDVFVTGMHLQKKYGYTLNEIKKSSIRNIHTFNNTHKDNSMDFSLSKTIHGFSAYLKMNKPDLIIVHGDRIEALAGATCGALNNTLVAHIEGGEVSGTIDDSIRHAVSKFAHIHLVTDAESKKRLIQLGENRSNIFILGSPDHDLMKKNMMPSIQDARNRYDIKFKKYSIVLYHSVTSEVSELKKHISTLCKSIINSKKNYIVIYPNNDLGSKIILDQYKDFINLNENFKIFPSIRFEYFLTLLKNSEFIIGNSSCGLREAPYFNVPTINIGSRQNNRSSGPTILDCGYSQKEIQEAINKIGNKNYTNNKINKKTHVNSAARLIKILKNKKIWNVSPQKVFNDIKFD